VPQKQKGTKRYYQRQPFSLMAAEPLAIDRRVSAPVLPEKQAGEKIDQIPAKLKRQTAGRRSRRAEPDHPRAYARASQHPATPATPALFFSASRQPPRRQ